MAKKKTLIIGIIVLIAIIIGAVLMSGVLTPPVELKNQEFEGFSLDVPVDSNFILEHAYTLDDKNLFVGYINNGDHQQEADAFKVGNNLSEKTVESTAEYVESDGDIKIYKNDEGNVFYEVFKEGDEANIVIYGHDLNVMKDMAKSFKDNNFTKIATPVEVNNSTPPTPPTPPAPKPVTPTSLDISGGSFTTGSGESDKTYAVIDVGTKHAGESVIVQILYSRDNKSLNHGNLVPATIHSDGCLYITSAAAYHYFPDNAKINIYDTNNHLLTSKTVPLKPENGTQRF